MIDFTKSFANQYCISKTQAQHSIALYPNFIYSLALAKFYLEIEQVQDEDTYGIKQHAVTIPKTFEKNLRNLSISFYDSSHQWIALAFLLYPKILIKILELTEMGKQNPSHSALKNWQSKPWKGILEHECMLRNENEYVYSFLNIGNDEDIEGIKKVVEIYPQRNKLLWRNNVVNLWLKAVAGEMLNIFEDGNLSFDDLNEKLISPPDDEAENSFINFRIPFEPRTHQKLIPKDFSDETEVMDVNNIPDDNPIQMAGAGGGNQLDMNQNALSLFLSSLMPWNHIPQAQGGNEDDMDIQIEEEDDQD